MAPVRDSAAWSAISARAPAFDPEGATLKELLDQHPGLPVNRLELEVLESVALDDLEHVSRLIEDCRKIGVSFALDNFGTGYSSLTCLKRLPVDLIKIDLSFVRDMLGNAEKLAIVEGVIGLAEAFHISVIAEGVETVAQGLSLIQLGCSLGQGYGIARPMPALDMPGWINAWRPDPSWQQAQHRVQGDGIPGASGAKPDLTEQLSPSERKQPLLERVEVEGLARTDAQGASEELRAFAVPCLAHDSRDH